MTSLQLSALDGKFYVPCVVSGEFDMSLHALVDTGASVTAIRGDICRGLSLLRTGEHALTCVHGSHADVMVPMYVCTISLGEIDRRTTVYELGMLEEGGNAVDAILGIDMLGGCRVTLDWARMEGTLEV